MLPPTSIPQQQQHTPGSGGGGGGGNSGGGGGASSTGGQNHNSANLNYMQMAMRNSAVFHHPTQLKEEPSNAGYGNMGGQDDIVSISKNELDCSEERRAYFRNSKSMWLVS